MVEGRRRGAGITDGGRARGEESEELTAGLIVGAFSVYFREDCALCATQETSAGVPNGDETTTPGYPKSSMASSSSGGQVQSSASSSSSSSGSSQGMDLIVLRLTQATESHLIDQVTATSSRSRYTPACMDTH